MPAHAHTQACMRETAKFVGVSSAVDVLQHLSKSMGWRDWLWVAEFKPWPTAYLKPIACESGPKNQNLPFVAPKEAHRVIVLHLWLSWEALWLSVRSAGRLWRPCISGLVWGWVTRREWEAVARIRRRWMLCRWGWSWVRRSSGLYILKERSRVIETFVDGESLGLGRGWSGESWQGVSILALMYHYGGFVVGAKGWTSYFLPVFSNVSSTQKWVLLTLVTLGSNYGWESAVAPCQHPWHIQVLGLLPRQLPGTESREGRDSLLQR